MRPFFLHLPEEILLLVLSYLDPRALCRLGQVCRKLSHFSGRDAVWRRIAKKCLNSGFVQPGTDAVSGVSVKERVRVSQNWKRGRCRRDTLLKWKRNLMPWIQLDGELLYVSQAEEIRAYQLRPPTNGLNRRPFAVFLGHQEDVCRFVLNNSHIISGAGSFVTGTACCGHISPLRIWDLQSGQLMTCLGTDFRRGAGVLDVCYETPYTLLSCGYDTYIRYWDIRTSTRRCVKEWEEPNDSTLYCMQSDGNHMIASGSSYYGVVRLWDKRMNQCLQSFSLSSPTSSPVYCLRFNGTHLYAALASALHVLDFTASDSRFTTL
ncbi:hypothetical protein FKM82_014496 [Ascaphus truei]